MSEFLKMRILILSFLFSIIIGCGPSAPPVPTDPEAIKKEIEREKSIRQGLEGAPPTPKDDAKKK